MLAETIHSHLLFILAVSSIIIAMLTHSYNIWALSTTYFHLLIFTYVGGLDAFTMIANTAAKTAEEAEEKMHSVLVVGSFALHCAALVCTIVCIIFNDVERIMVRMPTIVVVVILTFATSFNAIAAILLYLYKPKDQKEIMLAAAVVSTIAVIFAVGVLLYFYKRPPIAQHPPPPQFFPPPPPP